MDERELQKRLQAKVKKKLQPLFARYKMDFDGIDATMKWKPMVFIVGNYSSGKSTLINELVGQDIQRTGQAPTDDSFTIITSDSGVSPVETPGATLVSNENMPFQHFKGFGEKFVSHFRMKQIPGSVLENMAIIDSPGMLDATSENARGYDYRQVLGEFAKMADLIVLMFDPHKAGTIKESYDMIRNTLPETSAEDRIVFALSRIDECDNLSDLIRSYGTLCWNMSQMTGRKDIPHIYLTYAPSVVDVNTITAGWPQERDELIEKIKKTPSFRVSHILEDIGCRVNEVQIIAEAVYNFLSRARKIYWKFTGITIGISVLLFLFGDLLLSAMFSIPQKAMIISIMEGKFSWGNLLIPSIFAFVTISGGVLYHDRVIFKRQLKRALTNKVDLVSLDNDYRKNLWWKMESKLKENLQGLTVKDIWRGYGRSLIKINAFLENDLKRYYKKIVF